MPQTIDRPEVDTGVDTDVDAVVDTVVRHAPDTPWVTIVWDDPVNLMTYVSFVFRSYFGFSAAEAERLMLLVHNEGRAVVASGNREQMERHVSAMHGYGLQASVAEADG
jgi:ATP-dependent Clp protease adaptor protein ClpS